MCDVNYEKYIKRTKPFLQNDLLSYRNAFNLKNNNNIKIDK